ncbi:hypothetical protein AB0D63_43380 [Kitasatospora sp. NPDC048343]|uniref:hypothetical protein n=1 Tax=Kitasatospora sp. NPDC048343 TaxID=3154717 RepID=UPI0033F17EAD
MRYREDPYGHLSNDTKGGTMMSDQAYARTFGLEAYREMKTKELNTAAAAAARAARLAPAAPNPEETPDD